MKKQEIKNTGNQAKKIQEILECLKNRDNRGAFCLMYRDTEMCDAVNSNGQEVVETLMRERTNGSFFAACAIFEECYNNDLERIAKARKTKSVVSFSVNYEKWRSGYSMGEAIYIHYKTPLVDKWEKIADHRYTYRGTAKRYNNKIKYGEAVLTVDLTGRRMKTKIELTEK